MSVCLSDNFNDKASTSMYNVGTLCSQLQNFSSPADFPKIYQAQGFDPGGHFCIISKTS